MIAEESILEARIAMAQSGGNAPEKGTLALPHLKIPEPTAREIEQYIASDPEVAKQRAAVARKQGQIQSIEDRGMTGIRQEYYRELQAQLADAQQDAKVAENAARATAVAALRKQAEEMYQREHEANIAKLEVTSELEKQTQVRELADLKASVRSSNNSMIKRKAA